MNNQFPLMKNALYFSIGIVAVALTACSGGSDQPSDGASPDPAVSTSGSADSQPATAAPEAESDKETAQAVAQRVAEGAQQAVAAVENTAAQAQKQAEQATEQAQELLQQAKGLLQEKKVLQAGALLDQAAALTLNDEQQQLLAGLKAESQNLLTEVDKGLDDLKTMVAEKNYSEATSLISTLTEYELSSDQQSVLDGLRAEMQKLMESETGQGAAKAVNDLLGR
jgi:hypothetical protein